MSGSFTPGGGAPVQGNSGETDQSRTLLKSTVPPENRAPSKLTRPDDRVPDLADRLEGKSLPLRRIWAGNGLVGHTQIGTQDVDAGLPVLLSVVGQARHGVHPRQPDLRRSVAPEPVGRRGEPLTEGSGAPFPWRSIELLTLFPGCLLGIPASCAVTEVLRDQGSHLGQEADTSGDPGGDNRRFIREPWYAQRDK